MTDPTAERWAQLHRSIFLDPALLNKTVIRKVGPMWWAMLPITSRGNRISYPFRSFQAALDFTEDRRLPPNARRGIEEIFKKAGLA